jgi:methanogenic corrinoid protein MtbC1
MTQYEEVQQAILKGDKDLALKLTQQLIENKTSPLVIVEQVVQPSMDIAGKKFENFEMFLPDLMLAGEAAKAIGELLSPLFTKVQEEVPNQGTIVLGTAFGTPYIEDLLRELTDRNLRNKYKVLLGGGAVGEDWVKEIGADGYGIDAPEGVRVAKALIESKKK